MTFRGGPPPPNSEERNLEMAAQAKRMELQAQRAAERVAGERRERFGLIRRILRAIRGGGE